MKNIPEELKPYFRKTIANPEGNIVHYGDCSIFNSKVCDCGLLRNLMATEEPKEWYKDYWKEIGPHVRKTGITK